MSIQLFNSRLKRMSWMPSNLCGTCYTFPFFHLMKNRRRTFYDRNSRQLKIEHLRQSDAMQVLKINRRQKQQLLISLNFIRYTLSIKCWTLIVDTYSEFRAKLIFPFRVSFLSSTIFSIETVYVFKDFKSPPGIT